MAVVVQSALSPVALPVCAYLLAMLHLTACVWYAIRLWVGCMSGLVDVCSSVCQDIFRVVVLVCSVAMHLDWSVGLDSDLWDALPLRMLVVRRVIREVAGCIGRRDVSLDACQVIITTNQHALRAPIILIVHRDINHPFATKPMTLFALNARRPETMEPIRGLGHLVHTAACIQFRLVHHCVCHSLFKSLWYT